MTVTFATSSTSVKCALILPESSLILHRNRLRLRTSVVSASGLESVIGDQQSAEAGLCRRPCLSAKATAGAPLAPAFWSNQRVGPTKTKWRTGGKRARNGACSRSRRGRDAAGPGSTLIGAAAGAGRNRRHRARQIIRTCCHHVPDSERMWTIGSAGRRILFFSCGQHESR